MIFMEFDKELFIEVFMDSLSKLSPMVFIMISINLGLLIVNIFRRVVDIPASCSYSNIADDEDNIDKDDVESVYIYNSDFFVDFALDNNSDPIKNMK